MNYKEFVEQVKAELPDKLPENLSGASITENTVEKLQGQSYEGITVKPQDSSIGITMNMEPYFQQAQAGVPMEQIVQNIADRGGAAFEERPEVSVNELMDYEAMKPKLIIRLVGTEGNQEMLQTVPHKEMEDMSIVYRLNMGESAEGRASILVNNQMMEQYGITPEQLHQDAMEQSVKEQPIVIKNITAILNEMGVMPELIEEDSPMYVASNESRLQGAGVIAYPDFMDTAAEQLHGDFYVLPSSVHEVILLKDDGGMDAEMLKAMVSDVNSNEVEREDQLTDNAYHYDNEAKLFEKADVYQERKSKERSMAYGAEDRPSVLDTLKEKTKDCMERGIKEPHAPKREEFAL